MGIEQEPDDHHREAFEDVEVIGSVRIEEFSGIHDRLAPNEDVVLLAGLDTETVPAIKPKKGRKLVIVTSHRLLAYSSQAVTLLGEKETFRDISINSIKEMDVEERNGFDRIRVRTNRGQETFMVPDGAGLTITGQIREIQEHGHPLDDLDRLSRHHEEGNITEDEYEAKKSDLLDRI